MSNVIYPEFGKPRPKDTRGDFREIYQTEMERAFDLDEEMEKKLSVFGEFGILVKSIEGRVRDYCVNKIEHELKYCVQTDVFPRKDLDRATAEDTVDNILGKAWLTPLSLDTLLLQSYSTHAEKRPDLAPVSDNIINNYKQKKDDYKLIIDVLSGLSSTVKRAMLQKAVRELNDETMEHFIGKKVRDEAFQVLKRKLPSEYTGISTY